MLLRLPTVVPRSHSITQHWLCMLFISDLTLMILITVRLLSLGFALHACLDKVTAGNPSARWCTYVGIG